VCHIHGVLLKKGKYTQIIINPLMPNDLGRRRAVSPLKIKSKNKISRQAALRGGFNSGVKGSIAFS
jgi:hypothetical protein